MDTTDVLLLVLAGGQAIAIPVGLWIGKSIVDLKVAIAKYQVSQDSLEKRVHNLEEFKQQADKKLIQLWQIYMREQRDSRGNLPSHSEVSSYEVTNTVFCLCLSVVGVLRV